MTLFVQHKHLQLLALAIMLCFAPWLCMIAGGNYWVRVLDFALLYIFLALGLNIVVGFAGLLDLGYIAFYAVGAYCAGLLASPARGDFCVGWMCGLMCMCGLMYGLVVMGLDSESKHPDSSPCAAAGRIVSLPTNTRPKGAGLERWPRGQWHSRVGASCKPSARSVAKGLQRL